LPDYHYDTIDVNVVGATGTVILNRPDRLNALTWAMIEEFSDALRALSESETVRCVVLTGAGRAFCAGQDLAEPIDELRTLTESTLRRFWEIAPIIAEMSKPVIAAVNGVAAGAGVSLALLCDLRIACQSARFVPAFIKVGLIPDLGATYVLPRYVGTAKTLEFFLRDEPMSAADAYEQGLLTFLCADDDFQRHTAELAERLGKMPTAAIAALKDLLSKQTLTLQDALAREARMQIQMLQTEDHREGVLAFLEKRAPHFQGR
jgi:2-(1,2-epoxy-1,2-dihydrophenyl)acetyl-CoA isomerase